MIEEQYIMMMSGSVRNFKKIAPQKYRFSCPVCGDSNKVRSKARGNLFLYKGEWMYHCYNCGASHKFSTFIKEYFPELYDGYVYDKFGYSRKKKTELPLPVKTKKPKFNTLALSGDDIVSLDYDMEHPAVDYLKSRDMTKEMINTLYYTDNFKKWINDTFIPNKFKHTEYDDKRVVIPFFSIDKKLIGVQGRALDPDNKVRYITIKLIDDDEPLLYGLDKVDQSKPVYVLEGPIDSMFIDNAVAWAGGSLHKVDGVLFPVLVWDNEPRNKDIVKQIGKGIRAGHKVVIWPGKNPYKDVNDMIQKGINVDTDYLRERTFQGLAAQLVFDQWRKV